MAAESTTTVIDVVETGVKSAFDKFIDAIKAALQQFVDALKAMLGNLLA